VGVAQSIDLVSHGILNAASRGTIHVNLTVGAVCRRTSTPQSSEVAACFRKIPRAKGASG